MLPGSIDFDIYYEDEVIAAAISLKIEFEMLKPEIEADMFFVTKIIFGDPIGRTKFGSQEKVPLQHLLPLRSEERCSSTLFAFGHRVNIPHFGNWWF